jgi:formate hydrogenlyase transcriptional activator
MSAVVNTCDFNRLELESVCSPESEIVGESTGLRDVLKYCQMVAATNSTTLIQGETGTGKELVAGTIHNLSPRRNRPFVKVNCAAIPAGLLESELFGHERGAFTGAATQQIGRFERADGGTLFLDEVGDIPAELQPKLLRVLQEREFERLGSSRTIRSDVRVIAATHRDLWRMVEQERFRADLFYRLAVFPISVPPLRERVEDIPLLVRHFTKKFAEQMNRDIESIPTAAMEVMTRYAWPGNIRELQNFIERAVILTLGAELHAPVHELRVWQHPPAEPVTLQDAERAHILRTLQKTNGQLAAAAALLGLPRSTLFYKVRRLGIVFARPKGQRTVGDGSKREAQKQSAAS